MKKLIEALELQRMERQALSYPWTSSLKLHLMDGPGAEMDAIVSRLNEYRLICKLTAAFRCKPDEVGAMQKDASQHLIRLIAQDLHNAIFEIEMVLKYEHDYDKSLKMLEAVKEQAGMKVGFK